jgi:uncharacterized protein (TIGR03083 family)
MALARQERADLTDLLGELTAAEWEAPSLCEGWSVRDVVAHIVSYETLDLKGFVGRLARARLRPGRINEVGLAEEPARAGGELVDLLRRHPAPPASMTGFGGRIALTDTLVHHQDIRIPLGRHRTVPPDRLRTALPFAMVAPPLRGAWKTRGLRVVATDVDWSFGRGREVRGPAQVLLMAVAGRPAVLDDLEGPGVDVLRRRL